MNSEDFSNNYSLLAMILIILSKFVKCSRFLADSAVLTFFCFLHCLKYLMRLYLRHPPSALGSLLVWLLLLAIFLLPLL